MAKQVVETKGRTTQSWRKSRLCVLQPSTLQCIAHEVGPTFQPELLHRSGLVRLDGFDAQADPTGNLFVAVAGGDEAHHLGLPVAQVTALGSSLPRWGTHK